MKGLKISNKLTLPASAVTQTFGILAMRGAGKSNTAAAMAEEMFAARLPFVVVDPVGHWWGLRSSGDGKKPGLPIPIFGGKHGDVPLEAGAGNMIADLIVDKRLSCVLDLKLFESEGAKKRFLLDLAKRIYAKNEDPLHLFLEEADDYIPQKPMRDEAVLLRAWENIVRRGRGQGLGITLITQRSAVINKNVLEEVDTLIVLRTTGPRDRNAIRGWLRRQDLEEDLIDSLPGLRDGEAWVWSPHFLGILKRIQMRRRWTFDSAATPKNIGTKERRRPATLADINLSAIHREMAATIERAQAQDPSHLKRRIVELERQIKIAPRESVEKAKVKVTLQKVQAVSKSDLRKMDVAVRRIERVKEAFTSTVMRLEITGSLIASTLASLPESEFYKKSEKIHLPPAKSYIPQRVIGRKAILPSVDNEDITGPEQRILNAIAWLEGIGQKDGDQAAVAFLAGYTVGSGGFNNPKARLRSRGLVEYRSGRLALTDNGRTIANPPNLPLTTADLHDRVLQRLPGPERKILSVVLELYPKSIDGTELAERAGYTPNSGGFNNPRGRLKSLGLIEYPGHGMIVAKPLLFLEG